jgi:hypothetical protein
MMMNKVNGTTPINWYKSTSQTRWKLRVRDTLIRDRNNSWAFSNIDTDGYNFADATVDTFFRAIQIPKNMFPEFASIVKYQFNKQPGPAQGKVKCDESEGQGNCWVQESKCVDVQASFTDIIFTLDDGKGYIVPPTSYLMDLTMYDKDLKKEVTHCVILI